MARQKKPSPTPVPSAERTLSKAGARRRARRKSPAPKTPPSSRRRWTLDEAAFLDALPTAVRQLDDPVVQVMRANPGRWIVWNEATRAVHMVTDHFNEACKAADRIASLDDPDVKLDLAPGFHPDAPIHRGMKLQSWESPNVLDDVRLLWGGSADAWLDCPNPHFGGRTPRQLVGTDDELFLREMLSAVRFGGTS